MLYDLVKSIADPGDQLEVTIWKPVTTSNPKFQMTVKLLNTTISSTMQDVSAYSTAI
jgi:hypothetical protein